MQAMPEQPASNNSQKGNSLVENTQEKDGKPGASKRARISEPTPLSYVTPQQSQSSTETSITDIDSIRSLLLDEAGYDTTIERPTASRKRNDYISWNDFFFGVAVLSSRRSKNPHRPYGACIVDADNRVVGIGYDGLAAGCSDECIPYNLTNGSDGDSDKKLPYLHTQTPYIMHAEVNAILNKCNADVAGCRMFVEHFPCESLFVAW